MIRPAVLRGRIGSVDFARELDELRSFLTSRGFRVAVIGGVALAAYGRPRLTIDLDVVTFRRPSGSKNERASLLFRPRRRWLRERRTPHASTPP
jgi:hypothetical protein